MDFGPDVSVVVATYNRCASLERLLRALSAQTYPSSHFEVVVVDDGSTDGTSALLRDLVVPYALYSFTQANQGPAAARSLGVRHARGSLILFLDDDVVPVSHLIAAHRAAHDGTADRVVTGPMLPPPNDWPQPAWDRWDAAQLQKQYQAMLAGLFACSQRQFFTANASVHRELFEAVGGFDVRFRRAEDMELAWRLSGRGARFVFEPSANVVHFAARPFASWSRNAYQYGRYDVIMEREKAIPVFELACREFHSRRAFNRWMARLCVGRTRMLEATVAGLSLVVQAGDRLAASRVVAFALSIIFNLRYWQGVSDELGGPDRVWEAVRTGGEPSLGAAARIAAQLAEYGPAHVDTQPSGTLGQSPATAGAVGGQP